MNRLIRRSADEVTTGVLRRKSFSTAIKSIDQETRRIDFIISTESVDRYGDIIRVKGWDLKAYKQNPVVLFGHMNREPPVGKSIRTWKEDGALRATAEFMSKEISPFADSIFRMYQEKFLRAVSVGFLPLDWKYIEAEGNITGYEFVKQDLLEFSVVPVPANPDALMNARAKGIDVTPFKHWAEKALDEWQDHGQEVRDLYGVDKKTVEAIRRKAAGTGMVLRLSPEEQRKLAQRNMGVEISITAKDLTGSGEEAQEKDQDTMKIKQGIVLVDAGEVAELKTAANEAELFLIPLGDEGGKKKFIAIPQLDESATKGAAAVQMSTEEIKGVKSYVIDKAPKVAMFDPAVLAKDSDYLKTLEKDGNVLIEIKGSNFTATYKLAGCESEDSDVIGELVKAAEDAKPDSRVSKDADDTKKNTGASADKTDAKDDKSKDDASGKDKDGKAKDADTKVDDKSKETKPEDTTKEDATKDTGKDATKDDKSKDMVVIDLGTEAASFEAKLVALEEALDKSKESGQTLSKTVSRKLEFLAGYMRELAERLAPGKGKSISLGSDPTSKASEKGADDEGFELENLGEELVKSVEPKLAAIVERELGKLRGKLD